MAMMGRRERRGAVMIGCWNRSADMTKRLWWNVVVLGVVLSGLAAAADVSGKWKAEFTSPDGTQRVNTFTFKAEGEKLSGTVAGSQDETAIENGKVAGDEISFTAERPFGSFAYKGKVSGDEIKFKVTFNDETFEITAKREK
jgi:hypothetical protein